MGGVDDGQCRAARRRSCPGRRRPAARHGGPGLEGRRGAPGPVVERHQVCRGRGGSRGRTRSSSLGRSRRFGPAGQLHRDQAALAGPSRTRERRTGGDGAPAARLVDLADSRPSSRQDDRPWRCLWHRLLVPADRRVPDGPAGGVVRPCGHGAHGLGTEPAGRIHRRRWSSRAAPGTTWVPPLGWA